MPLPLQDREGLAPPECPVFPVLPGEVKHRAASQGAPPVCPLPASPVWHTPVSPHEGGVLGLVRGPDKGPQLKGRVHHRAIHGKGGHPLATLPPPAAINGLHRLGQGVEPVVTPLQHEPVLHQTPDHEVVTVHTLKSLRPIPWAGVEAHPLWVSAAAVGEAADVSNLISLGIMDENLCTSTV
jgi:hypothetical protein